MNATVTLPIGELDGLRDTIKTQEEKLKEFESNQKRILVKVEEKHMVTEWKTPISHRHSAYPVQTEAFRVLEEKHYSLEEVEGELQRQAEEKVQDKVDRLKIDLKWKEDDYDRMKDRHQTVMETRKKAHEKSIKDLTDQIAEMKGEKVEKRKDLQIRDLKKELTKLKEELTYTSNRLDEEKKKGFWSKLF